MAALLGAIGRYLMAGIVALFGGWKTFLGGWVMKACLVIILYNFAVEIIQEVLTWVLGKLGGVTAPGGTLQAVSLADFSSLGAWVVNQLMLPQCFAFMLSCVLLKWSLRKIPFIRW